MKVNFVKFLLAATAAAFGAVFIVPVLATVKAKMGWV